MSTSALRVRPQIARIARLLDVDPTEVRGLDDVPDADLRLLHDQVSHAMYAEGQVRFAAVAGLSRVIPGPLAGRLAERFLPPVLAARVSECLEPARARDLVGRVRIGYLADIAVALDPVRSRPVVRALPAARIGEVAVEMFGRGEYVVMAEFVATVTREALAAALEVATPHDLLAVTPLLEWNDDLDYVVAHLPVPQVRRVVETLTSAELVVLAATLGPERCAPIVEQVATALSDERLAELADELVAGEHWDLGSALLAALDPDVVDRLLGRSTALSADTFEAITAAADAGLLSGAAADAVRRAAALR